MILEAVESSKVGGTGFRLGRFWYCLATFRQGMVKRLGFRLLACGGVLLRYPDCTHNGRTIRAVASTLVHLVFTAQHIPESVCRGNIILPSTSSSS